MTRPCEWLAISSLALCALLLVHPAMAEEPDPCADAQTPEQHIFAGSVVIEGSANDTPNLEVAYLNRGLAYSR